MRDILLRQYIRKKGRAPWDGLHWGDAARSRYEWFNWLKGK
jgi:hypothetical protein